MANGTGEMNEPWVNRNSLKAIRHNMHRKLASKLNEKRLDFFLRAYAGSGANRKGCMFTYDIFFISSFVTNIHSVFISLIHTEKMKRKEKLTVSAGSFALSIASAIIVGAFSSSFYSLQMFIKC